MADREPYKWITVKGKHIPVYKDEYGQDVFGKGSDTKKRVDQKDLTNEKIVEEIAGKDSYMLTPEYRELSKQVGDAWDKMHDAKDKRRELDQQLKPETIRKPKEEWTTEDEITELLGVGHPVKYTEKGLKIKEEWDRWDKLADEYESQWSSSVARLKEFDRVHEAKAEKERALRTSAEKISTELKDDYYGFERSRTTTSYIDDKLEKGTAQVWSMSPKAYIQEAAYNIFNNSSIEKTIRGRSAKDVAKYMTMMEEGVKFHTPYLNYEDREQEGLHRAIAAHMMGIEEIPVVVVLPRRRH